MPLSAGRPARLAAPLRAPLRLGCLSFELFFFFQLGFFVWGLVVFSPSSFLFSFFFFFFPNGEPRAPPS